MPKKINELPEGNVVSDSTLIPSWNSSTNTTERITGGQLKIYIDAYVDSTLNLSEILEIDGGSASTVFDDDNTIDGGGA